jgi:hypothetical protein
LETEFITRLRDAFWNWKTNYDDEYGQPDEYMRPFSDVIEAVTTELPESTAVREACDEARRWIEEFVAETPWEERESESDVGDLRGPESAGAQPSAVARSVFDDLVE